MGAARLNLQPKRLRLVRVKFFLLAQETIMARVT
jgi:hypothetical protein